MPLFPARRMTFRSTPDAFATPLRTDATDAAAVPAAPPTPRVALLALERLAQRELAQLQAQSRQRPEEPIIDPQAALLAWDLGLTEAR